jgi:protocatechuate 3,4-dioxygenase beta subunit
MKDNQTRRGFLLTTGTLAAGGLSLDVFARELGAQELAPTPACEARDAPTVQQTEGPFFKPRSPQRGDLRDAGAGGVPIELTGFVLTRRCQPVAGALVDLWHADHKGDYDNGGFRFRGHQFTDAGGRYRFRTIRPAVYSGRTAHYHVKVQQAGGRILTTQLYFPNEPANRRDSLFRPELQMKIAQAGDGQAARFDFVLDIR